MDVLNADPQLNVPVSCPTFRSPIEVSKYTTNQRGMSDFANLEAQDVREHWGHEELEFTPWLASEIEAEGTSDLEDVLGLDLEVVEREKSVGKYKVDIFGRVVDSDRTFIIENQLTNSDHDHLGKSLAYAAGVDADIIVWIAPDFNDEHLDAVQWLNENSREGVDLFAIKLEVWKIKDSPPAVRLNPIEKPSEWKEKAQRRKGELSDRERRREEFWTTFRNRIREESTRLRARKPQPRHYYSNPIGVGGYHISFYVDESEEELGLELTIEDNADAYVELKDQAAEIENELGAELYWGELRETRSGKMRGSLGVKRDADIENRDTWDEYLRWMLNMGGQFHEVFPGRLRQLE